MRGLGRLGRAVLMMTAAAGTVQAQTQTEKPKIALYIASDGLKPNEKTVLTSKFLAPFTASGLYSLIDRSDIFTQKATQERIKQRDGSVNDKEIYKIGYEAGAKYVCMVQLENAFGKWNIAARMVDVVTAEIYLAQGETDIKGNLEEADFSGAAKTIFDQIHGKSAGGGGFTRNQQEQTAAAAPTFQPSGADGSGTLIDNRDGKKYRTVAIGGKNWMAENLNVNRGKSWCYENDNSYCGKYGRLYDWNTAMTVCPAGWHLPSRREWSDLTAAVGGDKKAGKKLKSKSGWNKKGNGTDEFGFSALPGGSHLSGGRSYHIGEYGYWWTVTEVDGSGAYSRDMNYSYNGVNENYDGKGNGFSVRCVQD